ncbi:MAG: hypothetical protein EOS73_16185 [Mesorhizobium sp.]|uniref:hypothetical protein n=1 Tax=Mesorhizobium sp. M7A.F.Ca.ET.027.02.1.1 TaxID=2496655 RepID=UPI000FD19C06|nr:hypothetical protein [Mesorhizobium sp. M7A.F.Ca.ET.027.02.1.1]RVD14241.1 hypothetical protein EN749_20360 [Mesorhizobium sp. M7A.F.Ca.ET.027.02.1.1]RWD08217.1 MAG: hypothetical protein EOS73_16185 [Mesorhizobium sp.]
MPVTKQDRANIRRIFDKVRHDIQPALDARERKDGGFQDPQIPNLMVAQNTLRACMEVVLNECLPYDDFFCGELAVRLAAYAISAVPIERHDALLQAVQTALPATLANKLREGAVIKSTWLTDGVEHPNIPDKSQVQ